MFFKSKHRYVTSMGPSLLTFRSAFLILTVVKIKVLQSPKLYSTEKSLKFLFTVGYFDCREIQYK
jgi:hypothetical protein